MHKELLGGTGYESIAAPFAEVKDTYGVRGLTLYYPNPEQPRPRIATILK